MPAYIIVSLHVEKMLLIIGFHSLFVPRFCHHQTWTVKWKALIIIEKNSATQVTQIRYLKQKMQALNWFSYLCILLVRSYTSLFTLLGTGWGRAHKKAIQNWYKQFETKPDTLARLVTKYKNREGWTHKDVLRLAHPSPEGLAFGFILR